MNEWSHQVVCVVEDERGGYVQQVFFHSTSLNSPNYYRPHPIQVPKFSAELYWWSKGIHSSPFHWRDSWLDPIQCLPVLLHMLWVRWVLNIEACIHGQEGC